MTTDVVSVHPDDPFKQVVTVLAARGVDAAPVVDEGGTLLGVVSGSDLTCHEEQPPPLPSLLQRSVRRHARKARGRTARELMTSPARTLAPDALVADALHDMGHHHVGRIIVVEGGKVVGILTRSDVLKVFLRSDEGLQREVEKVVAAQISCPSDVQVTVGDGVVHLRGWVERTSCAWSASSAARAVAGVVEVEDALTSDLDDTYVHELSVRGPFC
jgi:CBS domain-containing protein